MTDQYTAWTGEKGRFWAEHADWFSRLLSDFGGLVVETAAFRSGERVLDVGCGGGDLALTAAQAVAPQGSVLGVDLSPDELDVARVRAVQRNVDNVEFRQADAASGDLGPGPVDVIVSRFGVMFFADPVAAFTHLRRALRPGGRLAFVCWRSLEDNEWMAVPRAALAGVLDLDPPPPPGAPGGSAFADAGRVRSVLDRAGFGDIGIVDAPGTVHLGRSLDEAVGFVSQMDFAKDVLARATAEDRARAVDAIAGALAEHAGPDGAIDLAGRTWLVHARA